MRNFKLLSKYRYLPQKSSIGQALVFMLVVFCLRGGGNFAIVQWFSNCGGVVTTAGYGEGSMNKSIKILPAELGQTDHGI